MSWKKIENNKKDQECFMLCKKNKINILNLIVPWNLIFFFNLFFLDAPV